MLCNEIDMGVSAEDAEAAKILEVALANKYLPRFYDAHGPFVSVQFRSCMDALDEDTSGGSAATDATRAPHPTLYGWIEKLNWINYTQIAHAVPSGSRLAENALSVRNKLDDSMPRDRSCRNRDPDNNRWANSRVCEGDSDAQRYVINSSMGFVLHVWSNAHSALVREVHSFVNPATCTLRALSTSPPESHAWDDAAAARCHAGDRQRGGQTASTDLDDELENRNDLSLMQNAMDSVILYGKALEANPDVSEVVSTDDTGQTEYIHLVPRK